MLNEGRSSGLGLQGVAAFALATGPAVAGFATATWLLFALSVLADCAGLLPTEAGGNP